MPQRQEAAIVGIHEYPLRVTGSGVSALQIKAASASRALEEAGLSWGDVDAVYDTGADQNIGGLGICEYFGLKPNVIDNTQVGGSSFEFHANHAAKMIASGKCRVALLTYGSTAHSDARAIGTGTPTFPPPAVIANMEEPWGLNLIGSYAMVKARHMHQYGTTDEQFAGISVVTRRHAMRNPEAVRGLTDLGFSSVKEVSVEDVLNSRLICYPLHLLECCLVTDGGGAVVIAAPDVVRNTRKKPVWIIGTGEATKYRENGGDITVSAGAQAGPRAFEDAGISPSEVDILMAYDSFTITVMCMIEDLGFCKKGEGGAFVSDGRLHFDDPRKPSMNTDGGGLSSNHPGMRGLFLLIEAVRQLRGESTSQAQDPRLAVAVGNGGQLGTRHATAVTILAAD